jgi:hypothetical protein
MRRLLTAGAAVALALTGLIAAPRAMADYSSTCANNYPSYVTEQTLVDTIVHVGTQRQFATSPATISLAVCYSDTPLAQPSNFTGGFVKVTATNTAPNTWEVRLECRGDSATMLASVNCDATTRTVTTTSTTTSPLSAGATISGWTLVENSTFTIGTTGANTGSISTTSTNPEVHYGGTCLTLAGITPPGSRCTSAAIDAEVARGDVATALGGTTGNCLVTAGGCLVYQPRAGIVLWGDAANPTYVAVLGVPVGPSDPGVAQCYGSC